MSIEVDEEEFEEMEETCFECEPEVMIELIKWNGLLLSGELPEILEALEPGETVLFYPSTRYIC